MSSEAPAPASVESPSAPTDYEKMVSLLDVGISEAARKIDEGRVRDADKEKVRIKWVRALAYAINVRRQLVADRDLEELQADVEALKEARDLS